MGTKEGIAVNKGGVGCGGGDSTYIDNIICVSVSSVCFSSFICTKQARQYLSTLQLKVEYTPAHKCESFFWAKLLYRCWVGEGGMMP